MCGRYQFEVDKEFEKRFDLEENTKVVSDSNVLPGALHPVIVASCLESMKWGLVPSWEERNLKPKGLINIRAESVMEKNWARNLVDSQRCLVPATAFFEWQKSEKKNIPILFKFPDRHYFAMAGVFNDYLDQATNHLVRTYSIITTTPNHIVSAYHDRMPVILQPEEEQVWLGSDRIDSVVLAEMFKSSLSEALTGTPVTL